MGSGFNQVEAAHVWIRTAAFSLADPAKVGRVLRRVIDVFQGAIHDHQAQAKGEGSRRLGPGQGHTAHLKEGAQQPYAEWLALDRVQAARVGGASGSCSPNQRSTLLSLRKTAPKLWRRYRFHPMSTQTTKTSVSLRARVALPQKVSTRPSMRSRG